MEHDDLENWTLLGPREPKAPDIFYYDEPAPEPSHSPKPWGASKNEKQNQEQQSQTQEEILKKPKDESWCFLFGPKDAGKTCFLLAADRACKTYVPAGDLALQFIPLGETIGLIRRARKFLANDSKPPATISVRSYPFDLKNFGPGTPHPNQSARKPVVMKGVFYDGPGEAWFPEDAVPDEDNIARKEMAKYARKADVAILCVDMTDPKSNILDVGISSFFEAVRQSQTRRVVSQNFLGQHIVTKVNEKNLRIKRFLLILNKIDLYLAQRLSQDRLARRIAQRTDSKGYADYILGPPFISRLGSMLPDGATLAVTCCSMFGFSPSGQPNVDLQTGGINRELYDSPKRLMNLWKPFGIRDALNYVVDGTITGNTQIIYSARKRKGI